jgi:hypothetical protein
MKVSHLTEANVRQASRAFALDRIVTYLGKQLGGKLLRVPGTERFSNSKERGEGIRYVLAGRPLALRFNWLSRPGNVAALSSIDVWLGNQRDPNFNVHVEWDSFAKFLPQLARVLRRPAVGQVLAFPVEPTEPALTEAALVEAHHANLAPQQVLVDLLTRLRRGETFTRAEFSERYGALNVGLYDTIVTQFAGKFNVDKGRLMASPETFKDEVALKRAILAQGDLLIVEPGGANEQYEPTPAELELARRVPYKETLENLRGLVNGLLGGAFNALFVTGRGGTGKTQVVEDSLADAGLIEGLGYFKVTGTSSAAGLYALLYRYRDEIILFDDSDGLFNDVDARNLLKAATDTKPRRKLVWNKKASFIYDPDSPDAEEHVDDPDMAPRYFNFTGRIIFISNLPLSKLDPDGALRTRAFVIAVEPTDDELLEFMHEVLHAIRLEDGLHLTRAEREQVFEVVRQSRHRSELSLRKLVRALNLAASGAPNWKRLVELYA